VGIKLKHSNVLWHMPVFLATQDPEDHEFQVSLGSTARSLLKKKKKNERLKRMKIKHTKELSF
jgi:hypothetical protein